MFNKTLFNRNAFNRSVSLSTISLPIVASGTLKVQLVMRSSPIFRQISGAGSLGCGIVMRQRMEVSIIGTGEVINSGVNLRMSLKPIALSGTGTLTPRPNILVPLKTSLSSEGAVQINNRLYFTQQMVLSITGKGSFKVNPILQSPIHQINLSSTSKMSGFLSLPLPVPAQFTGSGELVLRRLGAMNENILELININLLPGETVTIDTDLLQVLFGAIEDVSSVTSDSIFFELNPGENEITISSDSDSSFDVTAVWQNRWL